MRSALVLLSALLLTACASTGSVPRPFPGANTPTPPRGGAPAIVPPASPPLIATALSYRGVPYRDGGSDPSGFDCSGFVQWVFAQHGLAVPRETRDQYRLGDKVDRDEVRAGDLVFFQTVSKGPSHVGIALDRDTFVHAPSSRGVVRVERYTAEYWRKRYVGARRVSATQARRTN